MSLEFYLEELKNFCQLQKALYTTLETIVTLKPVDEPNYKFVPTYSSISEQIEHWPEQELPIPPAAWVESRKGSIKFNDEIWDFAFHGAGLSFINTSTGLDISIEYSNRGELGITKYIILTYLKTLPQQQSPLSILIEKNSELFDHLVKREYLLEVSPLLPFDDQIYIFRPNP